MVEIKVRLDNDDHYVGGNTKQYIVIHDTGNVTDSDEGNANYFDTGSRQASAHYFVDDDSITQIVKDDDGAWHCGDGAGKYGITNRNSIAIEMCRVNNSVTDKTEANTIDLVKMLMAKYNIPADRVVRHYDASRKNCPASFSANNWARWTSFKAKLVAPAKVIYMEDDIMFSEKFYLENNADVAKSVSKGEFKNGKDHYLQYGRKEGRRPVPVLPSDYCEGVYLTSNTDVAAAVSKGEFVCGAEHYLLYGYSENRKHC